MKNWIDKHYNLILTIPVILFIALLVIYPLFYTFRLSFYSSSMSTVKANKWVGFSNYIKLFTKGRFSKATKITVIFSGVCIAFETFFGVSLAVFLNRQFRGMGFVRTLSLIPIVATPVAISMVWKMMYDPSLGLFNFVLKKMGFDTISFLGNPDYALASLMVIDIWKHTPNIMLICLGGLSGIPIDSLEAAEIDGATKWQIIWKVTLPLLSPTIMSAVTLRLIDLFKEYDLIYATTSGGPGTSTQTINVLAYKQAFENFKFGEASATVMIFFVILVVLTVVLNFLRRKTVVDY